MPSRRYSFEERHATFHAHCLGMNLCGSHARLCHEECLVQILLMFHLLPRRHRPSIISL